MKGPVERVLAMWQYEIGVRSYLYGANVYIAIYEIIPNFDVRVVV